jgi:hypothetical protein
MPHYSIDTLNEIYKLREELSVLRTENNILKQKLDELVKDPIGKTSSHVENRHWNTVPTNIYEDMEDCNN